VIVGCSSRDLLRDGVAMRSQWLLSGSGKDSDIFLLFVMVRGGRKKTHILDGS
jgi:hypothetical protein